MGYELKPLSERVKRHRGWKECADCRNLVDPMGLVVKHADGRIWHFHCSPIAKRQEHA